jgi:hypothetical protein
MENVRGMNAYWTRGSRSQRNFIGSQFIAVFQGCQPHPGQDCIHQTHLDRSYAIKNSVVGPTSASKVEAESGEQRPVEAVERTRFVAIPQRVVRSVSGGFLVHLVVSERVSHRVRRWRICVCLLCSPLRQCLGITVENIHSVYVGSQHGRSGSELPAQRSTLKLIRHMLTYHTHICVGRPQRSLPLWAGSRRRNRLHAE